MTLRHLSVSLAISLPKSALDPASSEPPNAVSLPLNFASARAAFTSAFNSATVSVDVRLGAPTPYQELAS